MSGGRRLTLERFLRELPSLDAQQLLAICAAHENVGRAALERARVAAGEAARTDGILDELQDLHGTIIHWGVSQGGQSSLDTGQGMFESTTVKVLHDVRAQARPALLDAATGLFLEDRLDPVDRQALLDPVESVVG
ncbi:MAG TPA: hypothetical protein VFI15_02405 [Candidatus Limnocylindrales bacterium]|nr:hypothetical protein [Candidatus Limnocylindrales bacterium]